MHTLFNEMVRGLGEREIRIIHSSENIFKMYSHRSTILACSIFDCSKGLPSVIHRTSFGRPKGLKNSCYNKKILSYHSK
jgi:hypothetical protein